jgi:hypothetical protein
MVIRTKSFVVSERDLRAVLGRGQWSPQFWLVQAGILAVVLLVSITRANSMCAAVLGLFVVGVSIFRRAGFVDSQIAALRKTGWFDHLRWFEFSGGTVTFHEWDGTYVQQQLDGLFRKVERFETTYVLHVNSKPKGVIVLPFDAFETDADRQQFEALLAGRGVTLSHKS